MEHFGNMITTKRIYTTPAGPKTTVIRPDKDDTLISAEEQKIYRSGVGMLLCLVKHSRSDISNATRELSKVADGATACNFKYLIRVIKYILDTSDYGL